MHIPVASFPVDTLPSPLAAMVKETSEALPCPPDFVAVPILALLGATIGTSRVVEIKPGWRERPTTWIAVIGDPGSKKSPALDVVMKPFHKRQRELEKRYKQELAAYEESKKSKTKGEPDEEEPEPIMEQIFTTDSTVEAFAALLQQNPRGLAFVCDELTGWARAMNQYKGGKGSDRQSWLSFWNGAQVIVNRLHRKEPIIINNPFVCVAGCLPPDVLGELTDERGREDGFIHRILFTYPETMTLTWTDAEISAETQAAYAELFAKLWDLQTSEGSPRRRCARGGVPVWA